MIISINRYSADIGPRILNEYVEKYFQIEFPLPKVDMAAIPDFAAGPVLYTNTIFFVFYSN